MAQKKKEVDQDIEVQDLHARIAKIPNPFMGSEVRLFKGWIKTNLDTLFQTRQYTTQTVTFVLESFLFLVNHPLHLSALKSFADAGFIAMNQDVERLMLKLRELDNRKESRIFFQLMTSSELPRIPHNLRLQRCMYSTDRFSPLDAPYFDSYRTVSTTLLLGKCVGGHAFGEKTQGRIFMYLNCPNIPGLLINFESLIRVVEYEVILGPGLRFTWNKNANDELRLRMGFDREEFEKNFANGEWKIQDKEIKTKQEDSSSDDDDDDEEKPLYQHHRIYDVTFIPDACQACFVNPQIAKRVRKMQ